MISNSLDGTEHDLLFEEDTEDAESIAENSSDEESGSNMDDSDENL